MKDVTSEITSMNADGEHLSISTTVFRRGEQTATGDAPMGEEVAAILSGSFLVEAEDERYELSPGEAIIIPPRMARVWTCQSDEGALYRVLTKLDTRLDAAA
ncbi:hypothetical protein BH09PSE5_BH09PSE5_20430 [soil metagenome]